MQSQPTSPENQYDDNGNIISETDANRNINVKYIRKGTDTQNSNDSFDDGTNCVEIVYQAWERSSKDTIFYDSRMVTKSGVLTPDSLDDYISSTYISSGWK